MATIVSNIFTQNQLLQQANVTQKVKYNREHLITAETAKRLNTYLNFGVFPTFADTTPAEYDPNNDYARTKNSDVAGAVGVRSIFNRAGAVMVGSKGGNYDVDIANDAHEWRIGNNVPLMDSPTVRQKIRQSSGCTVRELVQSSSAGLMGQATYDYSDFMYCKHLGKVSNNYMITLRRFPLPVDDFIGSLGIEPEYRYQDSANNASCIGCMVTWLGVSGNDMSSILKYSYKMPFESKTAERQNLSNGPDADQHDSLLNNVFSIFDKEYRQQYQDGMAGVAANSAFKRFGIDLGNPPYTDYARSFEDGNKVYGPVDTIRETYMRSDAGLTYQQSFTLTFEYELRSYNGINGRQAMLDLISNILNVTYTTGSFWGGGYKGFAAHQSNVFANLNVFKARGGFTNFFEAFSEDIQGLGSHLKDLTFKDVLKGANTVGGMILSGLLNKLGRPQKAQFNTLLSPAPIGFWHVTIGNPKHPIMSLGNMIITNCTIEHQGPLGLDDFPTGIKVTVELDRGKPRDLRDIEKIYMQGTDRIYSSMGDKVFDMYKNSELYKRAKQSGSLSSYKPVAKIATVNDSDPSSPTVDLGNYNNVLKSMKKYFGTNDAYSIYVPAAEQEYGAGKKKPSTAANKNAVGGDGNTAKTGGYYGKK